jgi:hypothetical protein
MIEVEIDTTERDVKLMKKMLLVTALYSQIARSTETRQLIGEISLIELAKAIGISDHDRLRSLASKFDQQLAETDWTFKVDKKGGEVTWQFCSCGKEGCKGHAL